MKIARNICGLAAMSWVLAALPAFAQRVQFPTPMDAQATPPAGAQQLATPPAGATYAPPGPASPYPPPSLNPAPAAPLSTPVPGPAAVGQPGPYPSPVYPPPPVYSPAPALAPGAAVQPPAANWDPYATPGATPTPLLQQDPYFQSAGPPPVSMAAMQRVIQHIDLSYDWFAGNNGQIRHTELGINDVELSVTCAFPMFFNSQTPLLITPGFAVHYWEGPLSVPATPTEATADLPARTYDAYLDAAWNPQLNTWFGAELDARIGTYSDFASTKDILIRFTGKGEAVLTFSPSIKLKAGVWYLDRNVVKILPAGGICWTPNPDVYFNILFPNPKIGRRLTTWGNTDWWIYARGEYGGGTWGIKRNSGLPAPGAVTDGDFTSFDYNDIRVAVGLEFNTLRQMHGMAEFGGSFDREVYYQDLSPTTYRPNPTVFIRAGLAY